MKWNNHSNLDGTHAFLSASQHSWLNYDDEKLVTIYKNRMAAMHGTEIHEYAAFCIRLKEKLPKRKRTLNMYVNDAIGFGLDPEVKLYFSNNCYGTADAINFNNGFLRIHDLKTGVIPASLDQLAIYAALFCLEYKVKPGEIQTELRIYQNDDILVGKPTAEDILPIMDKIIRFDKLIESAKEEI